MPAHSKSELLNATLKEFDKLMGLVGKFENEAALRKREEDTSVKDVIAHRAHWIDLFLGWYWDGQAGKPVYFPAQGYKWNELKRYNAELRARQSELGWDDAVEKLKRAHEALVAFMEARSEAELYNGAMKGAKNAWTPGRWAEAAGPSHYRSASKFLRSCLREGNAIA